ncbi:winged helix-turn-helix domain-containing tetratricopeptide repeat protein [Mesorhizobium amorphae]|uniref:Adenylate cyclase n=1 Tax=Mesorhizobium amorphae CCNWGS0123 TaxID=1082933 RepID=G6Y4S0_9HYPH|nr:winged helix-turn-helix domain-containing protein [Mesorhizobium amorphae]ANT53575.1 adenylate cyclase [Mesorhizobium amorphae CCNWGS0123]EHH13155.1 Adenylate cyclase [Mesorhizobium amorphae CCNWGS0123]
MDLEFGNYRLKRAERLLLGPNGPMVLSARSFDILVMLLERPDEVIGKTELFDAVWPSLVVEENTLQVHISALRKLLPAEMIVTVHGRGYKYAGPKPFVAATEAPAPPRPSIAVLPFDNMSGDPEQDYFSDGITEDIIAELGKFREFLVIARNSSFQFRGKANDVAEVANKLGVQYVVEGSVRKIANRVRVTVQLIDASSTAHIWGEHYDRELDDIFAIQDEITQMIAARLARQARTAIASRARARPTDNMSAYEFYLRALQLAATYDYDTVREAEPFLRQAVKLDPRFAAAHALLSFVETLKFFWIYYNPDVLHSGLEIARTALQLDPDEAYGHLATGFAHLYLRQFRQAEISLDRAVALNPNDPFILSIRALHLNYTDRPDEALVEINEAQRRDPYAVGWYEDFRGIILTTAGRYREATACYAKMATVPPWSLVRLIVCHSELGEIEQAQDLLAKVKAHYLGLRLDEIVDTEVDFYEDPAVCSRYRAILQRIDQQE